MLTYSFDNMLTVVNRMSRGEKNTGVISMEWAPAAIAARCFLYSRLSQDLRHRSLVNTCPKERARMFLSRDNIYS